MTLPSKRPRRRSSGPPRVHSTAVCDAGCQIGEGTRIWHFTHVLAGARIGRDCSVGQGCFVGNVVIGDGCRIQNHVNLFDGVLLEDAVFCGPGVVFTNVTRPRAGWQVDEYQTTRVGQGATLGANCTVRCGVKLGAYCFVAAGAVVVRDVPPHALVRGVPAQQCGWVSRAGEPLEFNDQGEALCPLTAEVYRLGPQGVTLKGSDDGADAE